MVVLAGVLPDFASAFVHWLEPVPYLRGVVADMVGLLGRSTGIAAVVLYIMWRSGEGWAAFGMPRPRPAMDLLLAAALFAAGYVSHVLYASTIGVHLWALDAQTDLISESFPRPEGPSQWALTAAAMAANGFAEELVIWGFLFARLRTLLGSAGQAVACASLLFASYHIYQGLYGAGSVLALGLVHGAFFVFLPRLWPLAAAHAMWDLVFYAAG